MFEKQKIVFLSSKIGKKINTFIYFRKPKYENIKFKRKFKSINFNSKLTKIIFSFAI